jgi:hypothetical protein
MSSPPLGRLRKSCCSTRGELARLLQAMQANIEEQGGPPERAKVIELMAAVFARPVAGEQARSRLRLVE